MLTTPQAAAMLDVTRQHIRQLCAAGRIIGAKKQGRDWMIPEPIRISPGNPRGRPRRK